jgi:hypothetical protein
VILLYLCFRQILPDSDVKPEGDFDELLGNGKTVILYLHGTTVVFFVIDSVAVITGIYLFTTNI